MGGSSTLAKASSTAMGTAPTGERTMLRCVGAVTWADASRTDSIFSSQNFYRYPYGVVLGMR